MTNRFFTRPAPRAHREQGVALVVTVIVVAVLAVVGAALMQSVSADRAASRSVANYARAQLAAEAGAAAAQGMVADLIARYPDSATVWQNIGGGAVNGTNNEATVMYVRANAGDNSKGASPAAFGGNVTILAQPLVSRVGATPQLLNTNLVQLSAIASSVPVVAGSTVNLNATNISRSNPLVGYRSSTNPGAPITVGQWIYMSKYGGATNATNPYIARYAFWVEDESFKFNVNVGTNGARGSDSLGLSAAEARIDGSWGTSTKLQSAQFSTVISDRASLGGAFPTALTAALAGGISDSVSADEVRFLTTTHSAGLDMSRGGFKRFNINTVTTGDKRVGLDRIIAAITNANAAPQFGQRFYGRPNAGSANTLNAVTADHARIYLQKLAANIYDYLDADDQPTIVNNDAKFTLRTNKPAYGIEAVGGGLDGENTVAAMGVENLPRLQEYAIHARVRRMRHDPKDPDSFGFVQNTNAGAVNPTIAEYEIWIDHYFEFWNPGTRDITLKDAFLKIYDQPRFGDNITGPLASVDRETSEIPLNNITFKAGHCTILTTASPGESSIAANASVNGYALVDTTKLASPTDLVHLSAPDADRKFVGTTSDIKRHVYNSSGSYGPNTFGTNAEPYNRLFEIKLIGRSTGLQNNDYRSGVVIGNNNGILESFVGLPVAWSSTANALTLCVSNGYIRDGMEVVGSLGAGNNDNVRGGSLLGNSSAGTSPTSTEGDPRTLNEQLSFLNYASGGLTGSGGNPDQTRFAVSINDGKLPGGSTMGQANANYVLPDRWVDYSSLDAGSINAPLCVRNGALQTIGELGHVTDPARAVTIGRETLSRGGGRTLRVGQPEHLSWFDGKPTNASRTWTSWRLADIFTTSTNAAAVTLPGLINPNGALRDNGAALRAALFKLQFQPAGALGALGLAGSSAKLDNVVTNVVGRLTDSAASGAPGAINAFWERGEISELGLLSSGSALSSVNMSNVFDRGREELVRRSIEMITPRGSVFSVYAVGQALQVQGVVTNVMSSALMKSTFEVTPQFPSGATKDDFDPASEVANRFQAVTNYQVKVLSSFHD